MKGFTTVELIVSTVLAVGIIYFLFQIVITVNGVFIENDRKTEVLNDISLVSYELNEGLKEKKISIITSCGDMCYDIKSLTGDVDRLEVIDNIVYLNDYAKEIENTIIDDIRINKISAATISSKMNTIILIEISIHSIEIDFKDIITIVHQGDGLNISVQ